MPTEAEREYAARAGTSGDRYATDLDAIAWYDGHSGDRTQLVGRKPPNAWGPHDMLGDLWEWVLDWYGATRGQAPASGFLPVGGIILARLATLRLDPLLLWQATRAP